MDIGTNQVDGNIYRMTNNKYNNENYGISAKRGCSELVDNGGDNAGAETQCKKSRVGENISEISGCRVIDTVQTAQESGKNVFDRFFVVDCSQDRSQPDQYHCHEKHNIKYLCVVGQEIVNWLGMVERIRVFGIHQCIAHNELVQNREDPDQDQEEWEVLHDSVKCVALFDVFDNGNAEREEQMQNPDKEAEEQEPRNVVVRERLKPVEMVSGNKIVRRVAVKAVRDPLRKISKPAVL